MKTISFAVLLVVTLLVSQVASAQGFRPAPMQRDPYSAPFRDPDVSVTFNKDYYASEYTWPIQFHAAEIYDDRGEFMYTTFSLREEGQSERPDAVYWLRTLDCQVPKQGLIKVNRELAQIPSVGLDASPSSTTCVTWGYRIQCDENMNNCFMNWDPPYPAVVWLEAVWKRASFFTEGTSTNHDRNLVTGERVTQHCTRYKSEGHLEGRLIVSGVATVFTEADQREYYRTSCINVTP